MSENSPPSPRIIDLTLTLRDGMRGVAFEVARTIQHDGWNARTLHLYSHAGTHMDAQTHFAAGAGTIDTLPLESCMGLAWIVQIPGLQPRALIEESHLGEVAGQLRPGDSLLLRTDWSIQADNAAIYRDGLPRISEGLAGWCVQHRVKVLGVEPPSVADVNNLDELTRIHQLLLTGGVTIVEGLANLNQLRTDCVFFAALPLKILGGDGCPCRALAIENLDFVAVERERRGGRED